MEPIVEGEMRTPDAYWRVEVIRTGPKQRWYRIWHAQTVVADRASLATVARTLGDAYATLQASDTGGENSRDGAQLNA